MAWVEAVACGGRQKGVLLSFVSRAYFGARSLLPLRRSTLGSLERDRREKETGRLSVATYGDVKDREKEIQGGGGERATEKKEPPLLAGGDEGGLDGIRGMSCNNRAAIRASVLTTGGATARLGFTRLARRIRRNRG